MPYKEKDRWRAVVKTPAGRKTASFETKKEALKWEHETKESLLKPQKTSITYLDLCNKFLDFSKLKNSEQHYEEKKRILKAFGLFIKDINIELENISVSKCNEFMLHKAQDKSNNAANKYRKILKAAWTYIIRTEDIDIRNPWDKTEFLHHEKRTSHIPTHEDIQKILSAVAGMDRAFILTYLYTGARMREVWRLRWKDDVDLKAKAIRLATRKRSGGVVHYEWIPMIDALYELFMEMDHESEYVFINPKTQKPYVWRHHFMTQVCKRAGVKDFGYHGLRRFVASNLFDAGVGMKQIQKLLRHKNLLTTEKYILNMNKDLKDSMEILGNTK